MSRNILLADDSVTIRKVVELSFMEEDYELTAVGDGSDALAKLQEASPDLVIADVHMGEVGGFEVCRESKKRYPAVPVLLLVGTFEPFDPDDVEKYGADAFLKKPFDSQDLLSEVGRLLAPEADEAATPETEEAPPREETRPAAIVPEAEEEELAGTPDDDDDGALERPAAAVVPAADLAADGETPEAASVPGPPAGLSDNDVERIARRVAELIASEQVREIAWEVVPDMAEVVIKERLRELESQVEE